jgi:hypothetical protein
MVALLNNICVVRRAAVVNASREGVRRHLYNRADYEREMRKALNRWDAHLARLVGGAPTSSKVVPFPRRRA